MKLELLKLK